MPIRVLLVEDEGTVRTVAMRILQRRGFSVFVASSGEDALTMLAASGGVDVIISDVMMPGMSGLELAERVSATPAPPPVVLMSGFATPEMDPNTLRRLAVRFLPKPFTPDELESVVRQVVATKPA
ncbi:MAG TPA: response regulator [Gemmatimonadales bacterium]|nr:response regulator [Gemmatimonadales bacterium]